MSYSYPHIDYDPVDRMITEDAVEWPENPCSNEFDYSLRDMVSRFTRGLPVSVNVRDDDGHLDGSEDFDDLSDIDFIDVASLDIEELHELRSSVDQRIAQLRQPQMNDQPPSEAESKDSEPAEVRNEPQ